MNATKLETAANIDSLISEIKENSERSVANVGFSDDGRVIFPFRISNYEELYRYLFSSPEFEKCRIEKPNLYNAFLKAFNSQEFINGSENYKMSKLLSAYLNLKKFGLAQSWDFYKSLLHDTFDRFLGSSFPIRSESPYIMSNTESPSIPNIVIDAPKRGGPKKPFFTSAVTSIQLEQTKRTEIPSPEKRKSELQSLTEQKNKKIDIIERCLSVVPFYKIVCGNDCKLKIEKSSDDDVIALDNFTYCPFHSSPDFSSYVPISKNLKSKMIVSTSDNQSIFGFLTKSFQCYDICHLNVVEQINKSSIDRIKDMEVNLNKILSTVNEGTVDFKKLIFDLSGKENEKKNKEIEIYNSTISIKSNLGEDWRENITKIQELLKQQSLIMNKVTETNRGKSTTKEMLPKLSILNYNVMSSLFGDNFYYDLLSKLDPIEFKLKFLGYEFTYNITDKNICDLIIDENEDCKNKEITLSVKLTSVGNNKYRCSLSNNVEFDFTSNLNFDTTIEHECKLIPQYNSESYKYLVLKIAELFIQNTPSFFNDDSYINKITIGTKMLLGSCLLSKYNEIIDFIITGEGNYYVSRELLEEKIRIKVTNDEDSMLGLGKDIIELLNSTSSDQLSDELDIQFNMICSDVNEKKIKLTLKKENIREIYNNIKDVPKIDEEGYVLLNNGNTVYRIHKDKIKEFFIEMKNWNRFQIILESLNLSDR